MRFLAARESKVWKKIKYAHEKDLLVIMDGKRGNIGPTCKAYAQAYLGNTLLSGDALTINPYLGRDGIMPFIKVANNNDKGIFILTKTSNPSSDDLQNIVTNDNQTVYLKTAKLISELIGNETGYSNIGAVVAGTFKQDARKIRAILKHSFFLVPGYGVQGARGADLVDYFDQAGLGALVCASRSIIYPNQFSSDKNTGLCLSDYQKMIVKAVNDANNDINKYRFYK